MYNSLRRTISLNKITTGDLFLNVYVEIPKKLTSKEESLLREIAEVKKDKVNSKKLFF